MILITKSKIIPTNTKPTTTGTANSSNKESKLVCKKTNSVLTCYYSGITSSITVFNIWVTISSTEI